jgi:uncharacterized membrane protein
MGWLRRSFVTGFFVTVPLVISVVAFIWIFRVVDGIVGPSYERWFGVRIPGLGILTTAVLVLLVGAFASNVLGRRLLQRVEASLQRIPLFGTIYSPVKQIVASFSPDNESGFKRVVIVDDPRRGRVLGFLTKEFEADVGRGPEEWIAVYVPTNNLYLGDLVIASKATASYLDMTVQEGVRVIVTGGMAMPDRLARARDDGRPNGVE